MKSLAFIAEFRALHDKARNGTLNSTERANYLAARQQFSRFVVVSQQLGHAGPTLRSSLRMAKVLKVEVKPDGSEPTRGSTIDLASGGFAILMPAAMPVGRKAAFTLYLPTPGRAGSEPISGRCAVASSRAAGGLHRVSFKFEPLAPDAEEQLAMTLIDAVLERFKTP